MTRLQNTALPELVLAARRNRDNRHPEAFAEIVRRFRGSAQASAYRVVRDIDLAQDVAQESFVDAYLGLDQLREPAAFAGWFRRIVFKHADRVRRKPNSRWVSLDWATGAFAPGPGPEAESLAAWEARRIRRAVGHLPKHERDVVSLFYFDDQSHAEIGERLVLPRTTVKKRLHDARRRMRIDLEAQAS